VKKRLLIYSDCYTFSGSENVILNILSSKSLQEEYEISFVYRYSSKYGKRLTQVFDNYNLQVSKVIYLKRFSDLYYNSRLPPLIRKALFKLDVVFDFFMLYYIVWIPYFILKIKQLRPDVIHINNGGYPAATSCIAFAFAARLSKVKKIIMHVNNLARSKRWYDFTESFIDAFLQKAVTFFVTGSKAAAETLHQKRGFSKEQIVNINNTLLFDQLSVNGTYLSHCSKNEGEIWIGFVGLLTGRKGVTVLLDAVYNLKVTLREKSAKIIIVGDGEDEQKLKQWVLEKDLDCIVNFVGYTSEVYKYLKNFDVFVLPSLTNEDFPYVLLEAMVCEKPIISTKVAGIPEIVLDEHSGFVVNPGSVNELSEKLGLLLRDPERCILMGKKGYSRYRSLFAYETTMEKFKALYSSAPNN
jgi:glycosyltransferase involved in cell wall biosynthesis